MKSLELPRTAEYLLLRCCERLHFSPAELYCADYGTQLHYLAYELIRQHEEQFQTLARSSRHD